MHLLTRRISSNLKPSLAYRICVAELYLRILNHDIGLVLYAADAAQLHHHIGVNEVGVMIHIDGFSDKIIVSGSAQCFALGMWYHARYIICVTCHIYGPF